MAPDTLASNLSGRPQELVGLAFDYVGEDLFDDVMLDASIAQQLSGETISTAVPSAKDKFTPPPLSAQVAGDDLSPGQSARIGMRGYRLAIYQYSFDGSPAGHSAAHRGRFNNKLPREWRANDGDYRSVTVGPACGIVTELITVYGYDGRRGSVTYRMRVIVQGLRQLGTSPDYVLIGSTVPHPSGHWVTASVATSLQAIAKEYRGATGDRLYFNDASLEWGGLFDIHGNWKPPHHEHRSGRQIDIAATPNTLVHENTFVQILRKHTTNYLVEGTGNARHYHVRF